MFLLLSNIVCITSCEKEEMNDSCVSANLSITDNTSREKDESVLGELLVLINERAQNSACTPSSSWRIMPIGAKACGGPLSFIAYNEKIDSNFF